MLLWFFFSSDIIFLSCIFKKTSLLTCLHIDSFWFVCFAYLFIYSCTILVIHYYSQTLPKNQNGWCYMDDHIISLLISRFPLSTAAPASAVRPFFPFFQLHCLCSFWPFQDMTQKKRLIALCILATISYLMLCRSTELLNGNWI